MDTYCTKCGGPWELNYIMHEVIFETDLCEEDMELWTNLSPAAKLAPRYKEALKKEGWSFGGQISHITECPACKGKPADEFSTKRSEYIGALHDVLGDDIDGIVSEMEFLDLE